MDKKCSKFYVAGHGGLVGSALVRALKARGFGNLLLKSSAELDLRDQAATRAFFRAERPDYVFLAAARVGGIKANDTYRADFIYDNLMIAANVIGAARETGVKRLVNLGSSCIYPRDCPQPMKEEHLLTGPLEPTNEPYAVAKIAALKLVESFNRQHGTDYLTLMPTNLYGPGDNFDLQTSHVLPALLRKFHDAAASGRDEILLWGSGAPRREFLHVDDLAEACLFALEKAPKDACAFYNVGTGVDVTIRELAGKIAVLAGFRGTIRWDASQPDGTPRKLLDVSRLAALGWRARIPLDEGLKSTLEWYVSRAGSGA